MFHYMRILEETGEVLEAKSVEFEIDPNVMLPPGIGEMWITPGRADTRPGDVWHNGQLHPRPAHAIEFNRAGNGWTIDAGAALREAKDAKKRIIDANTDALKLRDGLSHDGKRFSMTDAAMIKWTGLMAAAPVLQFPMHILTLDDEPYELASQAELMAFLMAVMNYETAEGSPLVSGRELRGRVEAAAIIEEVHAIVDDRR